VSDGEKVFSGSARCHPDDTDMMSEKTGCEIALRRAKINTLKGYRDELKIALNTLNHLYYSMNKSKRFNEKSYENRMLQRRIRQITFDLATTKEMIASE
jgi:queuine/archaeosine tRNA-ribosyltransferase